MRQIRPPPIALFPRLGAARARISPSLPSSCDLSLNGRDGLEVPMGRQRNSRERLEHSQVRLRPAADKGSALMGCKFDCGAHFWAPAAAVSGLLSAISA